MDDRNITEVIDRITAEMPEVDYVYLRHELAEIQSSATFAAPEMVYSLWRRLCVVLLEELPDADEGAPEWVQKIGRIIRAEE